MKKNLFLLIILASVLFLAQIACSLPGVDGSQTEGSPEQQVPATATPEGSSDTGESQPQPTPQAPAQQPGQGGQQGGQPGGQQPQGNNPPCQEGFIANANMANGQTYQPGDSFQVNWTIENTGDCTWDSDYTLKLLGGEITTSESELPLTGTVNPGGTTSLLVTMQAPSAPGNYVSAWKMQNAHGYVFGQDSPPDAPLRIAIKVIPSGNQGNNPTPAPSENPEMLISGTGQTLLNEQCFDLNSGQEVDCNDSAADIKYQFTPVTSGKFHGQNNTKLANNRDDEPDKATCEAEIYPTMAHSALEEKFFCFKISNVVQTTYGWIQVERFDQNGVTFDFMTFKADMPEAQPINPNALFIKSQSDQVTMLKGECYDVQNGQLNEQCAGVFAGFKFEETVKRNIIVMQINPNEVTFAAAMSSEPTKSDCENASYNQSPIWPIKETEYYCYKFNPGMNTYFGWLRPTHFDSNGMTFDYLTWEAMP